MATVRVKLRESSIEGNKGMVYYQICHEGRHVSVSASVKVLVSEWNEKAQRVVMPSDERTEQYCNAKISRDLDRLSEIIKELDYSGRRYAASDVKHSFESQINNISVSKYMNARIARLEANEQFGTARNYRSALKSFMHYSGGIDYPMSVFNSGAVYRYSQWLADSHLSRNSISFYMRIWRAVYNMAVHERILPQTNPFDEVYTGVCHTSKRAIAEDAITRILRLRIDDSISLSLTRDLFIFSYCTRGMAFVDMAFLTKDSIRYNVLQYHRRKTSQRITVRIEPCIRAIISKYEAATRDSRYVFPIITSDDERQAYEQYHKAIVYYNRQLKILARKAGIGENISSYTSRHSWATAARNHNIPISVISAGMGHTSQHTTEIYLASLETSVIDDANKSLLEDIDKYIR